METLEERRLLVVGIVTPDAPPQNFANPEDTNYDGSISPADALVVINALNDPDAGSSSFSLSKDVDGDGVVSPRDALLVINRLNSRSDTSSVPPQQRAIGLRKALESGYVPPNMSLTDAQEMLETLENGGHYEAGDRYRNGQMLNIKKPPNAPSDSVTATESEGSNSTEQFIDLTGETVDTEMELPRTVEQNDPLALLESADETLSERLHDSTLWRAFLDSGGADDSEFVERISTRLADRLAEHLVSADAREQLARAIADASQTGDRAAEDIINEIAALRATLGDAHSQIAQLFANLDVEGIIDQLSVDLGTLAEAVLSHVGAEQTEREAIFAEFLSREYLHGLGAILP